MLQDTKQLIQIEKNKKKLLLLEQKKKESRLTSKYNLKIVKIKKVTESLIADINTRKKDFLEGMKAITQEQKNLE